MTDDDQPTERGAREPFWWDLEGTETTFVENMQVLRTRRKWSQTEFARRLRDDHGLPFHQPTIQRIESGERPVKLHEAFSIARTFGTTFQAMSEDVSLTFAYDNLLDQTNWKEIQWALERGTEASRGVNLRVEEIEDALQDYRAATEKFGAEPNADAVVLAEALAAHLRQVSAAFQEHEAAVKAHLDEMLQMWLQASEGSKARAKDYHGEREWLRGFKLADEDEA